jgi:UDP-N-acetylmuramate dehydrogenase
MGIEYKDESDDEILVTCGSGETLDELINQMVDKGYSGLENLSAIPGTVGAAPVQNVGAYGVDMSELIFEVEAFDFSSNQIKKFTKDECKFGYRESFFKTPFGKKYFIVSVSFKLKKYFSANLNYPDLKNKFIDSVPTLKEVRLAIIEIRSKKFPDWKKIGTAGSFFKNPIISEDHAESLKEQYPELPQYPYEEGTVKIPLGYVLDKICNLKGFTEGNVGLYKDQALVLVNYGGATSEEIKKFAMKVSEIVYEKTKLEIEPEVRFF